MAIKRQSVTKAQKPTNSTILPPTDILQRKTINRIDFGASTVDKGSPSGQQIYKPGLPGAESHFSYDFSTTPVTLNSACPIQAKLTVGRPNDKYEQEADRVAYQVMRVSDADVAQRVESGTVQPMQIQRLCPECEEETAQRQPIEEEEEEELQAKEQPGQTPQVTPDLEYRINSLKGGGQPLDPATRNFFEPRFGHDFSDVRVHTNGTAVDIAKSFNAQAFTLGNHVVMGSGEYQPTSQSGQRLLGHELTHVTQQRARIPRHSASDIVQRAEPVTTVTLGAVAAKCIIGAIVGALFDAGIQAALHSWRQRTWRFWRVTLNWCSIILSAILGCIAGPISAYLLEPWIAARLGTRLGGMAGTLIGKILLFIAKKLGMAIPKGLVGSLAKLNCISPEQSEELGVPVESVG